VLQISSKPQYYLLEHTCFFAIFSDFQPNF